MLSFIKSGAEDKVNEILVKAEEECNTGMLRTIEEARILIKDGYNRKLKTIDQEQKVLRSKQLSECKLKILQKQDELVSDTLVNSLSDKLFQLIETESQYKSVLTDLLEQCFFALDSTEVSVVCVEDDIPLVETLLDEACSNYETKTKKTITASIDGTKSLNRDEDIGGVVVRSRGGKIRCVNTLKYRLWEAVHQQMPSIRQNLFSKIQEI
ncbi:hypothetical protein GEMRC1_006964 [Eukaryota sp. GEM-RC1]